jgi:DNA-binding NtrC family response regulator
MLQRYDWPGNVRELENVIERAVILCESNVIGAGDLSIPVKPPRLAGEARSPELEDMEKEHILKVLRETGGNRAMASRLLGIDRKTLYLKLKKYGFNA